MRLSVTKEDASGMQKILAFFRGEVVLTAALVLALLSFLLTPPSAAAFASVDVSTLCMLFALMAVVAGLRSCGLFDWLAAGVKAWVRTCRGLGFLLMSLCFFFSMVITNDVALLTFVPFTLLLLADAGAFALMWTVVLETIAANLGSMMTPIGNPQNLYLYMSRGLALGDFVQTLLPYALVSYILLALGTLLLPAQRRETAQESAPALARDRLVLYLVLLAICLLSVLKVLPAWVAAVVVALAVALRQPDLLGKVDWALLATFLCFFIFVGNVKAAPVVSQTLEQLLTGRETLVAVVCSQVISNVPATLLLAPFTQNVTELLLGVNLGGLGTLVASLASLISFKLYGRSQGAQRGRYLLLFTVANFGLLALLLLLVWVLG